VARAKGQLREGFRHVWSDPGLRVPLLLMLTVGMLTYEFQVSLPVLARTTFGVDAAGYGLMQTAMSAGAVVGGLAIATRTHPTHRRLGLAAAGFGTVVLVLALAPTFTAALVVLPLVGVGSVLFLTLANATLQLSSPPEMRSRVMALYTVAFNGSTPIGAPIIGAVSEGWGAQWGLAVGGFAALLAAGLAWRSLRAQPDRRGTTLRSEHGPDPERDEAQAPDARSGTGDLRPRVA
jgi:predicted MFS family arabinose efflux permease